MMRKNNLYKILAGIFVLLIAFTSCKKESVSTFDIFKGLKIDFKQSLAADEVYVEFALSKATSGANMSKVVLTEVGGSAPVYSASIGFTDRFSYSSGVLILKTSNPSNVAYKITVYDAANNDITSSVTISYPSGKQVVADASLITDKETKTFPEGKTVYIDYTVISDKPNIKQVWLESYASGATEPSRVSIAILPDNVADKQNFRGAVRLNLNRDGGSKFRIYVTDEANDYIGDGYTSLNTNVNAGFDLAANKFLYAPDFAATAQNLDLTSTCFYSISKKKTYTYTEAKANSADIDFGIILTATNNPALPYNLNFYAINIGPNLASIIKYDISTWTTKRAPKFSAALGQFLNVDNTNTPAAAFFQDKLSSGLSINNLISKGNYKNSLTRTTVTITPGNMFLFVTPEGKYGAVFINGFGKDFQGRYYANIDVKVEK